MFFGGGDSPFSNGEQWNCWDNYLPLWSRSWSPSRGRDVRTTCLTLIPTDSQTVWPCVSYLLGAQRLHCPGVGPGVCGNFQAPSETVEGDNMSMMSLLMKKHVILQKEREQKLVLGVMPVMGDRRISSSRLGYLASLGYLSTL